MNRLGYIGIAIAIIVILTAVFAPLIATHDPTAQDLSMRFLSPSADHWFGTDMLGRDVFSRVVYGARISLVVGVTVVAVSAVIGIFIGSIAGFYGGWVDKFLSGYIFNVFLAFPGLLLAIALVAFLGAGLGKMILALCIIGWVGYARVMRGQVLKVREYDFVQAAKALGASNTRILSTHVMPNSIQPLIVQASLGMAGAVLAEASMSFLGLGIPPPAPSWGTMIEEARNFFYIYPHTLFFPGIAIAMTVLAFNFIGDGLREYLDPKQRAHAKVMRIFPLGDNALTVEFGDVISVELNRRALCLAQYFKESPFAGFIESVPAYASATIFYDPIEVRSAFPEFVTAFDAVRSEVESLAIKNISIANMEPATVEIPVIVDDRSALDLNFVSEFSGLPNNAVLDIFFDRTYTVFMVGFLPGFAYMGEVDERIAVPRKLSPRLKVPKGSVGIAGRQTGVYPLESPGGWQIIGRTEMRMFDTSSDPPVPLKPGNKIRFIRA